MKTIKGDLIKMAQRGEFELIAHGCNCMCAMGKGIALTIKQEFPEAYEADCQTKAADETKLGTCTEAEVNTKSGKLKVVNCYTQFHWRGTGSKISYDAIESCMKWIKENYSDKKIGLPLIGAGLGGGDWNRISAIIEKELSGCDVTIVEFQPES